MRWLWPDLRPARETVRTCQIASGRFADDLWTKAP
jgi:hypothetical protein